MPVTYTIDQAKQIIYTTCSGPVTMAEVLDHFRELESSRERPSRLHVLLDLSHIRSAQPISRASTSEQRRSVLCARR